jgi:hypothetical protein
MTKAALALPCLALTLAACDEGYQPSPALDTGVLEVAQTEVDPDRPMGNTPNRTVDYPFCVSDRYRSTARFFNSGSPCIDGMVALIDGRGCEELVYLTDEDGIYHLQCVTRDTCDVVHSDVYIAVPNDHDWTAYGSRSDLMCQDQNVSLLVTERGPMLPKTRSAPAPPETSDTGL